MIRKINFPLGKHIPCITLQGPVSSLMLQYHIARMSALLVKRVGGSITGMEVILVGFSSDGLSNLLSCFPGQLLKQQEIYEAQLSFGFG